MPTWAWITSSIIGLAALVSAITVIIKASKSVGKSVEYKIKDLARQITLEEQHNVIEMYRYENQLLRESIFNSLDANFAVFREELRNLNTTLTTHVEEQQKLNKNLKQGHLETWKNDIRTIYYKLRETGTITDPDKSYIDKIYHVYKELDGNSDIDAKYREICDVYARRTHEQFEKAYEETKQKPTKKKAQIATKSTQEDCDIE